jgi:broad specificity phosphatase PhoE
MTQLRRLVLVRHGEPEGAAGERLVGSGDPVLSAAGREQLRQARAALASQVVDLVVASPLRRAFQSATLLTGGAPIRLEPDFREIHFGRWEGRDRAQIEAADPALYKQWRDLSPDFEFPGGEPRAVFKARIQRGLDRVLHTRAVIGALLVIHKGVIRTIVDTLTGSALPDRDAPAFGEIVILSRSDAGAWKRGAHSSNPPNIGFAAPVTVAR